MSRACVRSVSVKVGIMGSNNVNVNVSGKLLPLSFCHVTCYVEAYHLGLRIGMYGDGLPEVGRHLALAAIGNVDGACLTWTNGRLGVFGHGAAARGYGLIDDQWGVAGIGEGEDALLYGVVLRECTKVVLCLLKGDNRVGHAYCGKGK